MDRRTMLKSVAAGGAAAWVAPAVLSDVAHASGGTTACIPQFGAAAYVVGGTASFQWTYLGEPPGAPKKKKWSVVATINYKIVSVNALCPCGNSYKLQTQQYIRLRYAPNKTGFPYELTFNQNVWTTQNEAVLGSGDYAITFGGDIFGNAFKTLFGDFRLAIRLICKGYERKAWNCRYYTATSSIDSDDPDMVVNEIRTQNAVLAETAVIPVGAPTNFVGCDVDPIPTP